MNEIDESVIWLAVQALVFIQCLLCFSLNFENNDKHCPSSLPFYEISVIKALEAISHCGQLPIFSSRMPARGVVSPESGSMYSGNDKNIPVAVPSIDRRSLYPFHVNHPIIGMIVFIVGQ